MKSPSFVSQVFRKYYLEQFSLNDCLSKVEEREFGFASMQGWMLRHKTFKTEENLATFLRETVPKDAYVSCAYYANPDASMEAKGWLGADLVFDIDSDHIQTSCERFHDSWACKSCGFAGRGIEPEKCPACGSEKVEAQTWPCEVCLGSAKKEACKLIDILEGDLGFSKDEIHVFFSGHRGYHIQIDATAVRSLDATGRKEIVDYVAGLGLDMTFHAAGKIRRNQLSSTVQSWNAGWNGRIKTGLLKVVRNASAAEFARMGIQKNVANLLIKKRNLSDASTDLSRGVGDRTWQRLTEAAIKDQSATIDTVVTTDIHRLIRLPRSLHGKTGFVKTEFSSSDIAKYDPFSDAVPFKAGSVLVSVSDAPKFRLGDQTFGPYRNEKIELPTSAAVLIACRNRGEIVERNV